MSTVEKLKQRISELMTENEIVKANSMKAVTTGIIDCDGRASIMYCNAKRENMVYQDVLELIDELEAEQ